MMQSQDKGRNGIQQKMQGQDHAQQATALQMQTPHTRIHDLWTCRDVAMPKQENEASQKTLYTLDN